MTTHTNPAVSSRTVFSLPYRDHSWASARMKALFAFVHAISWIDSVHQGPVEYSPCACIEESDDALNDSEDDRGRKMPDDSYRMS
jgi:hypothetical protein